MTNEHYSQSSPLWASLSLALVAPLTTSASAVQSNRQAVDPQAMARSSQGTLNEITPELIAKADPFVQLSGDQFILLDEADERLTQEEVDAVLAVIQQMNASIASATPGPGDTKTIYSNHVEFAEFDTGDPTPVAKYKEGVTKAKVYWWGIRVWLSRTAVRTKVSGGITIAGLAISIKQPVLGVVLGILGVVAQNCPGGIRFDTNPATWYLPASPKVWNAKWQ